MKKILIISPHFPPSNLASVHRSRLFAQHLPAYGWEPTILMVNERFYEEKPDYHLTDLVPKELKIEKVNAFGITKPRIIGDIGLRAFLQLYRRAKQLIKENKYDFLFIPIPSFYCALLGRWLHFSTGIKYGIDYIDPWVHSFPGSEKIFSRHWLSTKLAKLLEGIAIKNVSLVTGVAAGYYEGVYLRNPFLKKTTVSGAMPYGGEKADHEKLKTLNIEPYLFSKRNNKIQLIYAGAMLPNAYLPLTAIFEAIVANPVTFSHVEFHFIGTGKLANDPSSYNIKALAEKYDLWGKQVFEYPARIPYLDVLVHLEIADGIFVLGSIEPHYTPSKVYQGILSEKYILAVLHRESTAVELLRKSEGGLVLAFNGVEGIIDIQQGFHSFFKEWNERRGQFNPLQVNQEIFQQYSAKAVTGQLANLLNKALEK